MLFCIAAQHAACFTGMPLAAHLLKKVRRCTAVHPPPSSGGIRGCKSALSMSACLGAQGIHKGGEAHVVLESRPKQRPSLLGLSARSALARDAWAGCASRARGQRPLPVCPSPASFVRRFVRAECSGVLRCGPGRVGVVCLGKKQVEAGTDMRVFSAQPKAGTLPGDT